MSAVSRHGIVEVDGNSVVTSFLEKPKPTETASRLAVRDTVTLYTVTFTQRDIGHCDVTQ